MNSILDVAFEGRYEAGGNGSKVGYIAKGDKENVPDRTFHIKERKKETYSRASDVSAGGTLYRQCTTRQTESSKMQSRSLARFRCNIECGYDLVGTDANRKRYCRKMIPRH